MSKKLPKTKKSLKSFISEDDAKILDKTSAKVAITASFLSLNFLSSIDDANAQGHGNHTNHVNNVGHDSGNEISQIPNAGIYSTQSTYVHKHPDLGNDGNETKTLSVKIVDDKYNEFHDIEVLNKTATAFHGNHYNHSDGGGSS